MKKKTIALALALVMVFGATMGGTFAYLTSQTDVVTNTFTVGKVAITLDEAKVDEYGVKDGATRVKGNEYKLIPGHTYTKDPTVTVKAGSEDSYVRMIVTINCADALTSIFGADFLPQDFVEGWNAETWVSTGNTISNGNNLIYEFWYKDIVKADADADKALEALFTTFTMPGDVDATDLAALEDLEINVIAHAIQADGFDDANDAWSSWDVE